MEINAATIIAAVQGVTKKWAKVRRAEEREEARRYRRSEYLTRPFRETIKEVAWEVMAAAYRKASANETLPATARQIMYAARPAILERTKRQELDDQYFTQTLLPDYLADHPEETADWDVVFDARGHLQEPHTQKNVPLGTLAVREYLSDIKGPRGLDPGVTVAGGTDFPTCGPANRYGAILFIEKEGFLPLFQAVHLEARYDVAIMTTKGVSTTAGRGLVDTLCSAGGGVPLLVLHDFDKAGFSILGTLSRDTRRYEFLNEVQVIDLGLRLADVQRWHLSGESVSLGRSDPTRNLQENGATAAEISYLCRGRQSSGYTGRRVELNAFTSDQLIAWLEGKLAAHGVKKVVPSAETLTQAYRRALHATLIQRAVEEMEESIRARVEAMKVPRGLVQHVKKAVNAHRERPWDAVIAEMVAKQLDQLEST